MSDTDVTAGGARFAARIEAARRSPVGRFVRRHRERLLAVCVTMPGAALLSVKVQAFVVAPAVAPGTVWVGAVSAAAMAGVLTVSPRLQSAVLTLLGVAKSAVTTVLVMAGGITVATVVFWDRLGPTAPHTLDEAVTRLRADATALLGFLLLIWLMLWAGRFVLLGGWPRSFRGGGAVAFDRKSAARHEAAHALVASVLGVPFKGAWSLRRYDGRGMGGAVVLAPPPAAPTTEVLYGLMVRAVAVCVAGVAGDRNERPMDAILRELEGQNDWVQAAELSWLGGALRPDRVLLQDVLEAVVLALRTGPWKLAIAAGAKVLLRESGDPVPPEAFAAIARRFDLALPAVEMLAGTATCPPGAPTQGAA